jgi:hypothetical protein
MWLRDLWQRCVNRRRLAPACRPRRPRPSLERLEGRAVPSAYAAANVSQLIADINAANAAGGGNTIALTAPASAPYVLTAVDNSGFGPTGLPPIAQGDNLTIVGNGDTIERDPAAGMPAFRLFAVVGGSLTLQDLTVANGQNSAYGGGGIYNSLGTLGVQNCDIVNNATTANAGGGGILNNGGTLTMAYSTVSGNAAGGVNGVGGGLVNGGRATVTGCTFSGNQAVGGGAIWNRAGTYAAPGLALVNCTLANNSASFAGEGLDMGGGIVTVLECTLSGNSAGAHGGGISSVLSTNLGRLSVQNSIVAGNYAPAAPDLWGYLAANGYDLIGNTQGVVGTLAPTDLLNVNAGLGPLQNNGGPTQTMALLPGSPALGAGNASAANLPAYDQRGPGYARVVDGDLDIGAFEAQVR